MVQNKTDLGACIASRCRGPAQLRPVAVLLRCGSRISIHISEPSRVAVEGRTGQNRRAAIAVTQKAVLCSTTVAIVLRRQRAEARYLAGICGQNRFLILLIDHLGPSHPT